MSNIDETPQYSIREAARLLGVSIKTLQRWERTGKISTSRTLGGHRRYSQADIDRMLNGAHS